MDLTPFNDAIGISDILNWRECPQRMEHGMRRHTVLPDGDKDEPPGHTDWTNAYGSAVHGAIHLVETEQLSNEEAVDRVWPEFAGYLDPSELALLKEDLDTYRGDTPPGMELVAAEQDVRVPLFLHEGRQIFFRFKLDALYRSVTDPTVFYHRDYKSSKHRRTQADVDKDLQIWSYNWGIFSMWPECQSLLQSYEQLRFGNLTTSKNREQRQQMKEWLIRSVKAILADTKMEPKQNMFCPWCPLVVSCDQTVRSIDYWKGRLQVLAPITKEGRKTVIALPEGKKLEEVIEDVLPRMIESRKRMQAVEKMLKTLIEELPSDKRTELGWKLADRRTNTLSPEGLRVIHQAMGEDFYRVISLSMTAAEGVFGKPIKGEPLDARLQVIKDAQLKRVSSTTIEAA